MRYKMLKDNEGITVASKTIHRFACCDCGLVHNFVAVAGRGQVGLAFKRNKRATTMRRRGMKQRAKHGER